MKKIHFSIEINASREKVWKTLWEKESYEKWTSVFSEGSTYSLNAWKEGEKIQFLGPDGHGMVSNIDHLTPNEYISFRHQAELKDGIEQPVSENAKEWSGLATESYRLEEKDGGTHLAVELDAMEKEEEYFLKSFPPGLEYVKGLAEK